MIRITENIAIDAAEIDEDFIRASGPGGQHVNKVSSELQIRFDVKQSPSLPPDDRDRLTRLAGKKITGKGVLIIDARRFRSQERNRQDAMDRLTALIRKAAEKPRSRRKATLSPEGNPRRLDNKHHRSRTKEGRRLPGIEE